MKGIVTAADELSARGKLRQMGVFVTSLSRMPGWLLTLSTARIKSGDLLIFTEELAAMLQAGISLGRAIDTLVQQTTHSALRQVLMDIREDVHRGRSLAEAMANHPQIFSHFYVQLVRVGEMSGQVDNMLFQIVEHVEAEQEVRRKISSALAYPGFVLIIATLVISVLMIFVMPRFETMYAQLGTHLPLPTQALIGLSRWIRHIGWIVLLTGTLGLLGLYRLRGHPRVRQSLDRWRLQIPLVGIVLQRALVTKFMHLFGVLISSGVPMIESLTLIESTAHNQVLARLVAKLRLAVSRGHPIADSLAQEVLVPPVATQMVAAGEESGDLGGMLLRASNFLKREMDVMLKRLINGLGPALTILLALLVGGIVLSIYLPIFEITSKLGR